MPPRACNHRTLGRRPGCEEDLASSVEAIHRAIGDFAGTAYFVDPNHPRASNQSNVGTDPAFPLRTVAAALAKVLPQRGDVIVVGSNDAWQYAANALSDYALPVAEEVTIPYRAAGVRIIGMNQGAMGVTWTPASDGGTCIVNHAIDVVIEGFSFTEGKVYSGANAIYSEWDGLLMFGENLTVRHCSFDDTIDVAIQLEYAWFNHIHDCQFWGCAERGIYASAAGSGTAYNRIHDNLFYKVVLGALGSEFDYSFIYGNQVYNANAQGGALATDEGFDTSDGGNNTVSDNYFSCLLPAAANGDYDNLNSAAASDAWINNHCLNGDTTTNPT